MPERAMLQLAALADDGALAVACDSRCSDGRSNIFATSYVRKDQMMVLLITVGNSN